MKWFVVAIGIMFLAGCRVKDKTALVEDGNRLFTQGRYADAELCYRKAIQKDPQYGEASYRLGLVELKLNLPDRAITALRRAVALMPENEDAAIRLARIYAAAYLARSEDDAKAEATRLTNSVLHRNSRSAQAMAIKGQLAAAAGETAEGERLLRQANGIDPAEPAIVVPLAQVLTNSGRANEAEKLLISVIARHPDAAAAYDALYLRYMGTRRTAEAEQLLMQKTKVLPGEPVFALQLCSFYASIGQRERLNGCITKMLASAKASAQSYVLAGDFYVTQGDSKAAVDTFKKGAAVFPAEHARFEKKIADALAKVGRIEEALAVLDKLTHDGGDSEAIAMKASLLLDSAKPDDIVAAVADLRKAVAKGHANDANLHFLLGRGLVLSGDPAGARRAYSEAVRKNGDSITAQIAFIEVLISLHEYRDAERRCGLIISEDSKNTAARLLRVSARTGLGAYAQARNELIQVLTEHPNLPAARVQLAFIELAAGNFADAEKIVREVFRSNPEPPAGKALAEVLVRERKHAEAISVADAILARAPKNPDVRAFHADIAARAGKPEQAVREYGELVTAFDTSADLHFRLANVLFATGRTAETEQHLERARQLQPANPQHVIALGALMESTGRRNEAIEYYRTALRLNPDNVIVQNSLAYNLAEQNTSLEEALRYAQNAARMAPEQPDIADTLAWVYARMHRADKAVNILMRVLRKNPANSIARYHLGVVLLQKGEKERAREELKVAVNARLPRPDSERARELLARIF